MLVILCRNAFKQAIAVRPHVSCQCVTNFADFRFICDICHYICFHEIHCLNGSSLPLGVLVRFCPSVITSYSYWMLFSSLLLRAKHFGSDIHTIPMTYLVLSYVSE